MNRKLILILGMFLFFINILVFDVQGTIYNITSVDGNISFKDTILRGYGGWPSSGGEGGCTDNYFSSVNNNFITVLLYTNFSAFIDSSETVTNASLVIQWTNCNPSGSSGQFFPILSNGTTDEWREGINSCGNAQSGEEAGFNYATNTAETNGWTWDGGGVGGYNDTTEVGYTNGSCDSNGQIDTIEFYNTTVFDDMIADDTAYEGFVIYPNDSNSFFASMEDGNDLDWFWIIETSLPNTAPNITWEFELPNNGSVYNASTLPDPLIFYFNATDEDVDPILACYLKEDGSIIDTIVGVTEGVNYSLNHTGLFGNDGSFDFTIDCDDGTNNGTTSLIKTIIYDTISPDIPLIGQAFPQSDNSSIAWNANAVPFNTSCGDINELWSFQINATGSNGASSWSFFINDLNVSNYTYDSVVDLAGEGYINGTIVIDTVCYDSHTKIKIKDYLNEKSLSEGLLSYHTGDNVILVLSDDQDGLIGLDTTKQGDRYDFDYNFDNRVQKKDKEGKFIYKFYAYSNNPIYYNKNDKYKAHFVIMGKEGGNWLDFNLPDKKAKYKIKRLQNNLFEIIIKTSLKRLKFSSVGGLNRAFNSASFRLGNTPPTMPNVISPVNNTLSDNDTVYLGCNGSIDSNGDTVVYDYFFINVSDSSNNTLICANAAEECAYNSSVNGWLYWSCLANDSQDSSVLIDTMALRAETWDIIDFNQSYSSLVGHSGNIEVDANISFNEIRYKDIEALINIEGDLFTTTQTDYNNYSHFTVDIPLNTTSWTANPLFFNWSINLTYQNDTIRQNNSFNGSLDTFTVQLYNCSGTNTSIVFNLTGFHEDTINLLPINIKGFFDIWIDDEDFKDSFVFEWNDTQPANVSNFSKSYYVCLSYDTPVTIDAYLTYNNPSGFTHRYYITKSLIQNNTDNEIHLYNFDYTTGISDLKGTIRLQNNYNYFSNVITKLQRFYSSENIWRTIQMDKSGDFGLIHFNIIEENKDYKFIFQDENNNELDITESLKFVCDPITHLCELTFLLDPFTGDTSEPALNIWRTYDNDTGLIIVNWNDPTGIVRSVRTLVTKETMGGTNIICDSETSSASGSYICNASAYTGQLLLRVYRTASPEKAVIYEWLERSGEALNNYFSKAESAFWVMGFGVVMALAGAIVSPVASIIMFFAIMVILFMMGLASFLTMGFITVLGILGILIGLKVKS